MAIAAAGLGGGGSAEPVLDQQGRGRMGAAARLIICSAASALISHRYPGPHVHMHIYARMRNTRGSCAMPPALNAQHPRSRWIWPLDLMRARLHIGVLGL